MVKLYDTGVYLLNGKEIIRDDQHAAAVVKSKTGREITKDEARKGTIAHSIINSHNTSSNENNLQLRFDTLTSHDITYVGIIQTARASGLTEFPVPYVLTNKPTGCATPIAYATCTNTSSATPAATKCLAIWRVA